MRDRERWLASTLVELADTGTAEFDEAKYAQSFSQRLSELLTPGEVSVLIPADNDRVDRGDAVVAAGSSSRAAALALLEAHGTAGPCAGSCRTGQAVRNESLKTARWPEFAAAAVVDGFTAVSVLPMRHHDETIGAVGVLTIHGHPLTTRGDRLACVMIEAATISILQQRALQHSLRTSKQLQHALDSRVVIEQAKGAVAAWLDVTPDDAFELLRAYSRNSSRRLTEVADDVLRGVLPAADLRVSGNTASR